MLLRHEVLASHIILSSDVPGILRRQQELQKAKVSNRNATVSAPGGLGKDRMPAGLLFGSAEGMKPYMCVSRGCIPERSTNAFQADRQDLPCEDRQGNILGPGMVHELG